jgi:PIN domain nuclease of toxin-antitoxin system
VSLHVAVTDAHALIWFALGRSGRLGRRARRVYEAAQSGSAAIYVPTIAVVEVFEAARRGLITLAGGAAAWTESLFSSGSFFPVELTVAVALRADELYAIPERADRLIAATAAVLARPLITRDPEIERHAGIDVIW